MEGPDYLRFVLAFAFVLALMGVAAYIARRVGLGNGMAPLRRTRRLNVLEIRALDHRHKLVLVSVDNREHVLLLGPEGQSVVEANIPPASANPNLQSVPNPVKVPA